MKTNNWDSVRKLHGTHTKVSVTYEVVDMIMPSTGEYFFDLDLTCVIIKPEEGPAFIGVATRSPRDTYSKKLGREIAAGRAMKSMLIYNEGLIYAEQYGETIRDNNGELIAVLIGKITSHFANTISSRLAQVE